MIHKNKIMSACFCAAMGMLAMTGCEGGEIYDVNAPDWISDRVQEIEDANSNSQSDEDVYTFGETDFSSAFWTAFSKYYTVPDGKIWTAEFELHINPSATNTYKNFALVFTNDVDRDGEGYKEYGVMRYDYQPSGNSEWGDYIDRSLVQSTLTFSSDTDSGIEKLGGKVTLTVDRSVENYFAVKITNGEVTKTYEQPYEWENLNAESGNTNIRCFLTVEGSYIDFLSSTIGTTGSIVSADTNPVSMVLQNVPEEVEAGTDIKEAMADVTALVTFEDEKTKTVTAEELSFTAIPDMDTSGEKTLVAVYNKTFKGENCDTPVMANASFEVIDIVSIAVTTQPTRTTYYYYTSPATQGMQNRTLAFDPTGMVVTATTKSGSTRVLDNSKLTFSTVPATAGSHEVTITAAGDKTTKVNVTVQESTATEITNYTATLGSTDNTTGFTGAYSDYFKVDLGATKYIKFKNYSSGANQWNNFVVALSKTNNSTSNIVFLRADDWAMKGENAGLEFTDYTAKNTTVTDWNTFKTDMTEGDVTVYVTNCGHDKADVQIEMVANGTTYYQYYLGINGIDPNNLYFALTVDLCHLIFGNGN